MKSGLENKRNVIALSVLGIGLLGAVYYSFFSDPTPSGSAARPAAAAPSTSAATSETRSTGVRAPVRQRSDEFQPVLHSRRPEKAVDPLNVDPTLRLDLLAKLDNVPAAGNGRDLFNFGKPASVKLAGAEPVIKPYLPIGPRQPPKPKPPEVKTAPPPPPIPLKYYGICTVRADGSKTAFFMDGEDILIQAEGSTFKGRYRLLRIGVNSAVVEDIQYKHEQTLPLAEDAPQGGSGDE